MLVEKLRITQKHGFMSDNRNRLGVFDALVLTDAEIGPSDTDLLSDDNTEPQNPVIRVGQPQGRAPTMEELQQLEELHEDDCELLFESVDHMFPALESNGRHIHSNLDWDSRDQTSDVIEKNKRSRQMIMSHELRCFSPPPSQS